jgi:hypothetical protein
MLMVAGPPAGVGVGDPACSQKRMVTYAQSPRCGVASAARPGSASSSPSGSMGVGVDAGALLPQQDSNQQPRARALASCFERGEKLDTMERQLGYDLRPYLEKLGSETP